MLLINIIAVISIICFRIILAVKENDTSTFTEGNVTASLSYYSIDDNGDALIDDNGTSIDNITLHNGERKFKNEYPFYYQIYIPSIYVASIIGVIENLMICLVIIIFKQMQTGPNVYFFSLANADLLVLCVHFNLVLCYSRHVEMSVIQWSIIALLHQTSNSVSVWTTVAITFDRYMALCHPFLARSYSSVWKAVKINISIWIVFLIYNFIQLVTLEILEDTELHYESVFQFIYSDNTVVMVFFVIPFCIITVLYICIIRSIWKSSKLKKSCNITGQSMTGRSLKLSVAVVGQFIFCFGPSYSYPVLIARFKNYIDSEQMKIYFYTVEFVCFVSPIIDPIVYCMVSKQFRKAFKAILCFDSIGKE